MSRKKIVYNILIVVLIATGFIGGMQVESHASEKKEDKCTIKTIAVVNLDEGVSVDGALVNYATQLMQFPDVNFVLAGLEEARSGVRKNQFAAYITIPSDFSKSTVSINEKPEKAVVTYQMNTKLREDIQIEVMQDVNNFLLTLSNNLSYMYIDAILNEFHTAQDNAQTVMENDNKDMQNITAVDSNSLIEPTELSEIQQVDSTVEAVDLEKEYQTADQIVKGITATYESNIQQGIDEFKTVKEGETAVTAAIEQTLTGMSSIDIGKSADGQPVYQGGIDAIDGQITGFQDEFNTKKTYAKALAGASVDPPIEGMTTLSDTITEAGDKINTSHTDIENQLQDIQDIIDSSDTEATEKITAMQEHLDAIKDALVSKEDVTDNLTDKVTEIVTSIDDIPILETNDFSTIVSDQMIKPIQDKCAAETEEIKGNTDNVKTQMDTYQTALDEFDPYQYLDKNNISTSLANLQSNLDNMQQKIDTSNQEYLNFTQEVYDTANENVVQLQQDMQKASESTSMNVVNVIEEAKDKRTQINEQNVEMLFNLTQKLPYTRLGSVEYTESYDFIVSPITVESN